MATTKNIENSQLINPFQPDYSLTKTLFNKESSSEYTIVRAAAKVANVVAAVLISIGETFVNAGKLILNGVIAPINFIHNLVSDAEVPEKKWYHAWDAAIKTQEQESWSHTWDRAIKEEESTIAAGKVNGGFNMNTFVEEVDALAQPVQTTETQVQTPKATYSRMKLAAIGAAFVTVGLAGIATLAMNYYNNLTSGSLVNANTTRL